MTRAQNGPWRGGGAILGTPTYIIQHNPRDVLIVLRYVSWGKDFFKNASCRSLCGPISEPSPVLRLPFCKDSVMGPPSPEPPPQTFTPLPLSGWP